MTIDLFERYASLDPAKAPGVQAEWSPMTAVPLPEANGREPGMQTQQQTPTQPRSPKPKRTGLLIAAAFVLAFIVGAVVLFSNDGASEPATTPPAEPDAGTTITPTEALAVGDAYVETFNTSDADAVLALLTSDVRVSEKYTGMSDAFEEIPRAFFDQHLAWSTAQGTSFTSPECAATDDSATAEVTVSCQFGWLYAAERTSGAPPVPTVLTMVVTSDGISQLAFEYPPNFGVHSFDVWLLATQADEMEGVEYGDWTSVAEAEQGGTLRAQYAKEWATYLKTNGCIFRVECVELQDRTPEQVIRAYASAYNDQDLDAVMAFFSDDSVIIGHPFRSETSGLSGTRSLHITDMAAAASSRAYRFDNVEVTGNTVTWDHQWTNASGAKYCRQGNSAVVKDGKILTWTWPADDDATCP